MNPSRIRLMAALIAAVAIGATSLNAAADPEHTRLVAMCGTWDVEMTFWFQPGRPGITT